MDKRKANERKWKKGRKSAEDIQDSVLRDMLECRGDEVTGEWRRWHTDNIGDPYCLLNVFVVIISSITLCWYVAWRG
jgi:hypothetical protein